MSLPAILWAMYEAPARTNPTEKCVLMVLAEHANPSGANAFPSWERIAKTVGVSTRTIGSTLSSLHAKGLIRRGDQRIAEAAVRRRGRSRAYTPTVWDLVMDGSHAAATQSHLPPAVDEDLEASVDRLGQVSPQLDRPAKSAGVRHRRTTACDAVDDSAVQKPCKSCRSTGGCSETCSSLPLGHEVSGRPGVKPASDEPSASTNNLKPPPWSTPADEDGSSTLRSSATSSALGSSEVDRAAAVKPDLAAFVAAVRAALPSSLARQPIGRALERRCAALADAGWTVGQITDAVRGRCWDGAGVGAVVAWLGDARLECPSAQVPSQQRVSTGTDLAQQYRRALQMAADSDSPARREAIRLAAERAAKARERRLSNVRSHLPLPSASAY